MENQGNRISFVSASLLSKEDDSNMREGTQQVFLGLTRLAGVESSRFDLYIGRFYDASCVCQQSPLPGQPGVNLFPGQ